MNLKLLQELIAEYKQSILTSEDDQWSHPFQVMKTWQYHWDMDNLDFKQLYDDSLSGDSPLWEGDDYHPKQMMLHYIEMNPDLARSAFKDLFLQKRDIVGRVYRFIYALNELKNNYQAEHTKYDSHYHDDRRMVMLYLTMKFPEIYTLYEQDGFQKLLKKVKAADVKDVHDIDRYTKVTKTVNIFIQKDEELMEYVNEKTVGDEYYSEPNLLLVHGLYQHVAG